MHSVHVAREEKRWQGYKKMYSFFFMPTPVEICSILWGKSAQYDSSAGSLLADGNDTMRVRRRDEKREPIPRQDRREVRPMNEPTTSATPPSVEGIVTRPSPFSVQETLERLKASIQSRHLSLFAQITIVQKPNASASRCKRPMC